MGAWGYGIFENDDALDVKYCFNRMRQLGLTMKEVEKCCMEDFPDPMNDVGVVLALAALQMEVKELSPKIKQRALQLIAERRDLHTWKDQAKRVQVLEEFKQQLMKC